MPKILLVDDDPQSLESTAKLLELSGFEVVPAFDGQAALEQIRSNQKFDLVISDVRMPRLGGLEFLRAMSLCGARVPVILMTAFGRVEDAVWAMKIGAVDFLTKPFKRQTLLSSIEVALKRSVAFAQDETDPAGAASGLRHLIGASAPMVELRKVITQVAPTAATVLISGESGTGKELVAAQIHHESIRASRPMIALNCAAVPEQLIESELFGSEKGAFTGATSQRAGLFEAADGGTLLLDEIGDMPLTLQAKLLRALQEGEIRRVGATLSRRVDVRVIAASHRDLREGVVRGTFREDLLYRLEVVGIRVPALRERAADIPELAFHFLKTHSERHHKHVTRIEAVAREALCRYGWPGNVRELSNVIERAVVFAQLQEVRLSDLPTHVAQAAAAPSDVSQAAISVPFGTPLRDVEDLLIRKTLEATSGDKNMTAKLLGINSRTISRKLAEKPPEDVN